MRVRLLTVVGALAVAGTVMTATAEERPRRQGRPGLESLQAELGLSADQAAQLNKLRAEGRKEAIRHRADLAIARIELSELMDARAVDENAIAAQRKAVSDLQATALKARTDQHLAMRRILSPEQQEKLKQLKQQNRRDRGPRPGRGWRHRQPRSEEGDEPPLAEPER
jgi:Spy/CpxP family protein refolding chaperone